MKAEKLSIEIAALERQSGKAKNAVAKKVLAKKIDKLKTELESITSDETAKDKMKKAKAKVNAMDAKEFNAYIKQLAKDPKFSFLKNMTSDEIVRDIKRTAKPVGWRFRGRANSKTPTKKDIKDKNNVYYEGRRNRSDVSRSVRLETGGGMMQKGGEIVPYIIWVSKDGDKRELYGEYKSKRAAQMAMDKLWDKSEYHSMGNKPKSSYEKEGFYAEGGGVDMNDWDIPVIRSQFEEEEFEFKSGGVVKYYNKENEYRLGRPSGSIEKEILDRVTFKNAISEQYFVGSFGWKTTQGKLGDGYLFTLDEFDQDLTKDLKLKSGEKVFRYVNRTTAIGGMTPFIKINLEKGLLYFPVHSDNDDVMFETRGVNPLWINIIEDKMANGGGVDMNDWDMPVIRTQFEDEEYEYAKGGETGEPHRTKVNGMMAKGGAIQHGLKVGDKIVADQFWENTIVVENAKTNKRAIVYLETGKRKEA